MARRKVYKVRHYKSPYRRKSRKNTLKIVLTVVVCALIFALSYLLLGPLTDFLYGKVTQDPVSSSIPIDETSSAPSEESGEEVPAPETVAYSTRYITEDELLAVESYDILVEKIKTEGFTTAVIPLKTPDTFYFAPTSELGIRTKAKSQSATELTEKLHIAGIRVVGTFETFKDNTRPRSIAVLYKPDPQKWALNTGTLEDPTLWISPVNAAAQEYILGLAVDAAATGVDEIVFKSFYFIDNRSAYFTDNDDALDRAAILTDVASRLKEALPNTTVSFEVATNELTALNTNRYGNTLFEGTLALSSDILSDGLKAAIEAHSGREIVLYLTGATAEDLTYLNQRGIYKVFIG